MVEIRQFQVNTYVLKLNNSIFSALELDNAICVLELDRSIFSALELDNFIFRNFDYSKPMIRVDRLIINNEELVNIFKTLK